MFCNHVITDVKHVFIKIKTFRSVYFTKEGKKALLNLSRLNYIGVCVGLSRTIKILTEVSEDDIGIGRLTYPLKVTITIDDNRLKAIDNLKPGLWTYIYTQRLNLDYLCVIINKLIRKNIIPELVFSHKEDRNQFFKHFYNGVTIDDGIQLCVTGSGKYLIADFSGAPSSAWNELKRRKTNFERIGHEKKIFIKPKLISFWTDEDREHTDVIVYVKTLSRDDPGKILPSYYDYEDRYLDYSFTSSRPVLIFVNSEECLPRPEKIFFSRNKIATIVEGLQIKKLETVDENDVGVPLLILENIDYNFFYSLYFNEKREFVNLFFKFIWGQFSSFKEFKMPDEFDKEHFSKEGYKKNGLMTIFFSLKKSIFSYMLINFDLFNSKIKDHEEIVFDVDETTLSAPDIRNKKVFLPKDLLFQQVFRFIFSKDMFYSDIETSDFDWLLDHIKEKAGDFSTKPMGDVQEINKTEGYQEKVDLPEQYGKESLDEIDCKKIILERERQLVAMFVPLDSKATLEHGIRDGTTQKIKYVDLKSGDLFERSYWTYGRLISKLKDNPGIIQEDPELNQSIQISEKFRNALRDFLSSSSDRDAIVRKVELRIKDLYSSDKELNYITMASWIDTVMCPIETSYSTIETLSHMFREKIEGYDISGDEFINASERIKSKRTIFKEENEKERIVYIVKKVYDGPFKVRGENVGKFYSVT